MPFSELDLLFPRAKSALEKFILVNRAVNAICATRTTHCARRRADEFKSPSRIVCGL